MQSLSQNTFVVYAILFVFLTLTVTGCRQDLTEGPGTPGVDDPDEPVPYEPGTDDDPHAANDLETSYYWRPFSFGPDQYFKYEITKTSYDGTVTGWFSVDFQDAEDGNLRVEWEGEIAGDRFASVFTAPSEDVIAQMMFTLMMVPSASPVVTTLLAPWWGIFFVGHKWELGAGWSFTSDRGSSSFQIVEKRQYGGVEGYLGRWVEDGSLKAEVCVAPDIPLPLYVHLNSDGDIYESELLEYRGPGDE